MLVLVTCPVMPVIMATFFVFVASERSAGLEHCAMFDSLSFLVYSLFVCFFKCAKQAGRQCSILKPPVYLQREH